jgi:hypothetical protein
MVKKLNVNLKRTNDNHTCPLAFKDNLTTHKCEEASPFLVQCRGEVQMLDAWGLVPAVSSRAPGN